MSDDISAGAAARGTQTGALPIGTVQEILERAPKDLVEETIAVPEWGCSVKIKASSAAQSAAVKQRGFGFKGEETLIAWAEMEIMQFQQGVIEPRFDEEQVRELHLSSGPGFTRVIEALDKLNKIDKEKLRQVREEFPGPKESTSLSDGAGPKAGEDED